MIGTILLPVSWDNTKVDGISKDWWVVERFMVYSYIFSKDKSAVGWWVGRKIYCEASRKLPTPDPFHISTTDSCAQDKIVYQLV